jgi:hypothetical protein
MSITSSRRCWPLLAAIAALFWLDAAGASAQSNTTWTEPAGRFTLDFAPLGWTELSPPDDDPTTLLGIEHRGFQETGMMRTCFMTERRQSVGPRLNQEQVNAVTRRMGPEGIARTMGATPEQSETIDVDGIAVIHATFTNEWRQQMRLFYLADGQNVRQIFLNCGSTLPVGAEVTGNIDRLLQSLHFAGN